MIGDLVPIRADLPPRSYRVYAVADVHVGSAECDLDGFRAFLKRVERDPDAYIVIAGDVFDNAIAQSVGGCYEASMTPQEAVDLAVELLAPVADRILAVVGGNHEERSRKSVDLDPLYTACCIMRINERYRRGMAFLCVHQSNGGRIAQRRTFLVSHGKSAAARKRFQYVVEGVDVMVTGHTHDGSVEKPARLCLTTSNNVVVKPMVSIVATSWLRYGGYGARALYAPKATSDPQHVEVEWNNSNNRDGSISVVW